MFLGRERVWGVQVACSQCLWSVDPLVLVKGSVRDKSLEGVGLVLARR